MKKGKVNNNKTSTTGAVIRTIFQQELKKSESRVESKMDVKLENLEIKVDKKAQQYRDQILTSNDRLMKELETHREEREIGDFQIKERFRDHEERIKILESSQKS